MTRGNTCQFILIGGQRCGTTWLYNKLSTHPKLHMPKKEIGFFNRDYEKGIQYYSSIFSECPEGNLCGEATPDYLASEHTPSRVFDYSPHIKLIAVLRNPIDRAYSAYWMFRNFYKGHTFESALTTFPGLLRSGLYSQHLTRWMEYFHQNQIKIVLYEDLKNNELNCIHEICNFLDIRDDELDYLRDNEVINAAIFPKIQDALYFLRLEFFINFVKSTPLDGSIRRLYSKNKIGQYPQLKEETRKRLTIYYNEDRKALEKILERSLVSWSSE